MVSMMYLASDYIDGLRNTHESRTELDASSLPSDPYRLFADWFRDAADKGVSDVSAVTIATVDKDGLPDARIVDLAYLDSSGFHFGTATDTAKVQHLQSTWAAALNFWWQPVRRAVRVRGAAKRVVDGERFNLWCVEPEHFEFFQLADDRLNSDRIAYTRSEFGDWDRYRIH